MQARSADGVMYGSETSGRVIFTQGTSQSEPTDSRQPTSDHNPHGDDGGTSVVSAYRAQGLVEATILVPIFAAPRWQVQRSTDVTLATHFLACTFLSEYRFAAYGASVLWTPPISTGPWLHHSFVQSNSTPGAPAPPPPSSDPQSRPNAAPWHIFDVPDALPFFIPCPAHATTCAPISIHYVTSHEPSGGLVAAAGSDVGVSLTDLLKSSGVAGPRVRIGTLISPEYRQRLDAGDTRPAQFIFRWPAYSYQSYELELRNQTGQYLTRCGLGKKIAQMIKDFMQTHSHEYNPPGPSPHLLFKLGENGIAFARLRLVEVYSLDGILFYSRICVVPPRATDLNVLVRV